MMLFAPPRLFLRVHKSAVDKNVWLSASYFLYYGILGVFIPYLGMFLDHRGFNSVEIGYLLAILTFTKIFGPQLWASFADKSGRQLGIIRLGIVLSFGSFLLLPLITDFWLLATALALFSMFWTAILPQMEVLTLSSINKQINRYTKIRLWGSIGYIALVMLAGYLMESLTPDILVWLVLILLVVLLVVFYLIKQPSVGIEGQNKVTPFWQMTLNRSFIGFFISALLLQVSFAPFYVFFTLYLQNLDYSGMQTGMFISLGVVAEIFIFMIAGRLIVEYGIKAILIGSLLLTALRWWVTGYYGDIWWVLALVQLLHAASFGLTHAASMQFIGHYFNSRQQSRAQALYVGGAFGAGGATGSLLAGFLWQNGAGATQTFNFAAIAALLATVAVLFIQIEKK
jgi:PPP family 3-phenylpropionic acid transporter